MMTRLSLIAAIIALFAAGPASAQLGGVQLGGVAVDDLQVGIPQDLPGAIPGRVLDPVLDETLERTDWVTREALGLLQDRIDRIDRLVRRNRELIERDARGEPARRGELLVVDARDVQIALVETAGFSVLSREEIEGLDLAVTRLRLPQGIDLDDGERLLARLIPGATIAADNLYFQSGTPSTRRSKSANGTAQQQAATSPFNRTSAVPVGMIDGAPRAGLAASTRGFATGAGAASDHGSAVAGLLRAAGASRIYAADVYGTDRAGGNALAIAQALGWLGEQGARVVTISLVGPDNPVLSRAIASARRRGMVVVAAVGNDGPAAPPAYPASYDGVVAVTAVDRRERALIEAGRALHLDYAAPGADIYGLDRRGRSQRLRGTSYATPLVAARIARALGRSSNWRAQIDSEAHDLGPRGPDEVFGRGLVCRGCASSR